MVRVHPILPHLGYLVNTKDIGSVGEVLVLSHLISKGYRVSIPFGDNTKYDLISEKDGKMERIQVKTTNTNNGETINFKVSCTVYEKQKDGNNRSKTVKYNKRDFEWLYGVDLSTKKIYKIPSTKVSGKAVFRLRLVPSKNRQVMNINFAKDFEV